MLVVDPLRRIQNPVARTWLFTRDGVGTVGPWEFLTGQQSMSGVGDLRSLPAFEILCALSGESLSWNQLTNEHDG